MQHHSPLLASHLVCVRNPYLVHSPCPCHGSPCLMALRHACKQFGHRSYIPCSKQAGGKPTYSLSDDIQRSSHAEEW